MPKVNLAEVIGGPPSFRWPIGQNVCILLHGARKPQLMEMTSQKLNLKPYFVGIDSDGTAFDSMEIKHRKVFQPVALNIWGLQSLEKEFC
jgi:hypothetical protein